MTRNNKVMQTMDENDEDDETRVLEMVSAELEQMRIQSAAAATESTTNNTDLKKYYQSFPPACLSLLKTLKGNRQCIDCGEENPQWATVSFGALLCLQCCGKHRGMGVQVSCVRSISMDNWSHAEVLSLLEGGNGQLQTFFTRHKLIPNLLQQQQDTSTSTPTTKQQCLTKENVLWMRYKTKAAQFYREQLNRHVSKVLQDGEYKGRKASRKQPQRRRSSNISLDDNNNKVKS